MEAVNHIQLFTLTEAQNVNILWIVFVWCTETTCVMNLGSSFTTRNSSVKKKVNFCDFNFDLLFIVHTTMQKRSFEDNRKKWRNVRNCDVTTQTYYDAAEFSFAVGPPNGKYFA